MSSSLYRSNRLNASLYESLKPYRVRSGLSQSALATELGVDQALISRVESGERKLSFGELMVWLEALGMSEKEMFPFIGNLWKEHGSRAGSLWNQ